MTVLVTAPTGTVGRHLVPMLLDRGVAVRAFVRDPEAAATVLGDRAELVAGDFADTESVHKALAGVDQVWLATPNHLDQVAWETAIIDAASAAGVRRIVKLSALDAKLGSPVAFADAHARITDHLRGSGVAHVLVKPAFMMANLFGAIGSVQQANAIFLPGAGASVAMIDPRDIAAVAASALTADGEGHARSYTITGPAAVTFDEVAAELSAVLGRPIGFVAVPDEGARAQLVEAGMDPWFAANLVTQFGLLREGTQADANDLVQVLTGTEPHTVADFLRDHAFLFGGAR